MKIRRTDVIFCLAEHLLLHPQPDLWECALLELGEVLYRLTRIKPEPLNADLMTTSDEIETYLRYELQALPIPFDIEFEDNLDVLIQERIMLHGQPLVLRVSVTFYLEPGTDPAGGDLLRLAWQTDLYRPNLEQMLDKIDDLLPRDDETRLDRADRVFVDDIYLASLKSRPFGHFTLPELSSVEAGT